jgi:hypothetical protein
MTPEILASIIISFCNIRSHADLNNQEKLVCAELMLNCSVGRRGEIEPRQVNECQRTYLHRLRDK